MDLTYANASLSDIGFKDSYLLPDLSLALYLFRVYFCEICTYSHMLAESESTYIATCRMRSDKLLILQP